MEINQSHINLYRYSVDEAGREALRERRPVSTYRNARAVLFHEARLQVARALFCAKLDGFEYSRLVR
jgi:hypothetical protein